MKAEIAPLACSDEFSRSYRWQVLSSLADLERREIRDECISKDHCVAHQRSSVCFCGRASCHSHRADGSLQSPTYLNISGSENFIEGIAFAIDGDTIRFEDGTRIRLEGVAAPENNEPGGTEATQFMKRLVNGNSLRCDLNGQRSYNRLVGICYLGGDDIGAAIIAAGLARDCPRFSGGRYASFETPAARQLVLPRYCRP